MALTKLIPLLSLALARAASAHFIVNLPPPLGNNIDNEDTAPCGGFTPSSSDSAADFHVGGDAIGISSLHAQSFVAYRGTLGTSLSSANWTALLPTLQQFGLNNFCEPGIAVPASWAGSRGLLQVIQDAEDGVHYQVRRRLWISQSIHAKEAFHSRRPFQLLVHPGEFRRGDRVTEFGLYQLFGRLGRFHVGPSPGNGRQWQSNSAEHGFRTDDTIRDKLGAGFAICF